MEPATQSRQFTPELERMVAERMATGKYACVDDLLCEALLALDEIHRRYVELKNEIQLGIDESDAGMTSPLDLETFKREVRMRRSAAKD